MTTIAERLQTIHKRIKKACEQAGREPSSVTLVAISKTKPAEMLQEAFETGQLDFGENYVQEMLDKQEVLAELEEKGLRWHFTGHLQRNKVRKIAGRTHLVHAVHSYSLAQELEKRTPEGQKQAILLQCNRSQEESKSGFLKYEDVLEVLQQPWERLEIQGLMEIPAWDADPEAVRPSFRKLREWRDRLQEDSGLTLPHLSMGMSNDLEVAVQEGATFVRIGTAIFGPRERK